MYGFLFYDKKCVPDDIACAPAQVARDPQADFFFRWVGVCLEEMLSTHQHPRRAKTALQPVVFPEGFLERAELTVLGKALHRLDLRTLRLHREHEAGLDAHAVEQDRAGAARPVLAAHVGACQTQILSDEVGQKLAVFCLAAVLDPVHFQGNGSLSCHQRVPPLARRPRAFLRFHSVNHLSTSRRYSALACTSEAGSASRAAVAAASANRPSSSFCPCNFASASRARSGVGPTPYMPMRASRQRSFSMSRITLIPAMTKSPCRACIPGVDQPGPGSAGTWASTIISVGSRAVVRGPRKKSSIGIVRTPSGPRATLFPPS